MAVTLLVSACGPVPAGTELAFPAVSEHAATETAGETPAASTLATPVPTATSSAARAWTTVGSMRAPRYEHTATLLPDGRVLIVGGRGDQPGDSRAKYLDTVELFDPATATWSPGPPMHAARTGHLATALADGRVLVLGGYSHVQGGFDVVRSAELYDPVTNAWATLDSPIRSRYGSSATLLRDGRVLLITSIAFEGWDMKHRDRQRAVFLAPESLTWVDGPTTDDVVGVHSAVALEGGQILVAGGALLVGDGPPPAVNLAAVFDPETARWQAIAPMREPRLDFPLLRLLDGHVLALGGVRPEIYDPAADTWTKVDPPLSERWSSPRAVVLDDGRVFAVGEHGTSGSLPIAELFDASTGTWSEAGAFPVTANMSVTRLLDGRVLVAGGYRTCYPDTGCEDDTITAEAYLFDPTALP